MTSKQLKYSAGETIRCVINGDNRVILKNLLPRFSEKVRCIYIDPPYNTDASSILYKNNYKDSAWLSLISSRLEYTQKLIQDNGMICVAIDDEEVCGLRYLLRPVPFEL